jgi:hypothetical protein
MAYIAGTRETIIAHRVLKKAVQQGRSSELTIVTFHASRFTVLGAR